MGLLLGILSTLPCHAGPGASTLRVATWNVELARKGPALLLRDIHGGQDARIKAIAQVAAQAAPDILVLQGVDYDLDHAALGALRDVIAQAGHDFPYLFALRPNTGMATGLDMDGDGRCCDARDAQGFGRFAGQGGMAILSRYPILRDRVRDFSALRWRDLPGAHMPRRNGRPFPSERAAALQRLSSVGHWAVPLDVPGGPLWLLTFHATPPVFDGPEDRNGLRNADEIALWQHLLDGRIGTPPSGPFIIAGDANQDLNRGEGRHAALRALLNDPRVQDPAPLGAAGTATVDWSGIGLGHMRVSYILPARAVTVRASGVLWPAGGTSFAATAASASRHRLVWVDVALPLHTSEASSDAPHS